MEPWLPFGDAALNVEAQEADPRSMLALHRRLLALRRSSDDLAEGAYATVAAGRRRARVPARVGDRRGAEPDGRARRPRRSPARCVLTTELDGREGEVVSGSLALRPGEGAITAAG